MAEYGNSTKYTPAVKYGWAQDDGTGSDQVYGRSVAPSVRRRKFGTILKLRGKHLTEFNTLPHHVEKEGLYREAFDAKYFEPTFEAKPYMATFDTNKAVNEGAVIRTIDRKVLDVTMLDFCKAEADTYFSEKGISMRTDGGQTQRPNSDFGGLTGGAYYDRSLNTIYTPANIFWARFNKVRRGDSGATYSPVACCSLRGGSSAVRRRVGFQSVCSSRVTAQMSTSVGYHCQWLRCSQAHRVVS